MAKYTFQSPTHMGSAVTQIHSDLSKQTEGYVLSNPRREGDQFYKPWTSDVAVVTQAEGEEVTQKIGTLTAERDNHAGVLTFTSTDPDKGRNFETFIGNIARDLGAKVSVLSQPGSPQPGGR